MVSRNRQTRLGHYLYFTEIFLSPEAQSDKNIWPLSLLQLLSSLQLALTVTVKRILQ